MEYYAQLDTRNVVVNIIKGDPTGRFDESIKWVRCPASTQIGDVYTAIDGNFKDAEVSLDDEKRNTLMQVNDIAQGFMDYLLAEFPQYEIVTWPYQIEEAKQLLEDENAEAIFLRTLSATRHIPLMLLAEKVMENNFMFRKASGYITGKRQMFEDVIKGATSMERLVTIRHQILEWKEAGLNL